MEEILEAFRRGSIRVHSETYQTDCRTDGYAKLTPNISEMLQLTKKDVNFSAPVDNLRQDIHS